MSVVAFASVGEKLREGERVSVRECFSILVEMACNCYVGRWACN